MAYIGQESEYIEFQKQTLTADGTTTVFTLDQAAGNANGLLVSVGGVVQEPDVAYTVSAFAITFAVAPTNGYTIYIVYLGKELTVSLPADNSITANAIVNSAVTDSKITSMAASKLSGSLSGVDGSALTGIVTDTSVIQDNIAMIGFKIASNNSLTRYNMVDQVIDEYQDDVGLLTETNVDRDSSGNYISTNPVGNATGTLVSTSNTASTAPTTGDLVVLVDDAYTASTINTDIKGYVSRDGGTGWDQTTLVDQGTWGSTNKKILSAHDVAFSNSASGTDMKYKLEWANQSYTAGTAAFGDSSSSGHIATVLGTTALSTTTKIGTHSMFFDGNTNDYITFPAHADFNSIGTGDYTFECWFNPDNTTAEQNHSYLFGTNSWDNSNNYSWFIGLSGDSPIGNTRRIGYQWYNQGVGSFGLHSGSTYFTPGTWYHVAMVRSNSVLKMYVDGVGQAMNDTYAPALNHNHVMGGSGVFQVGNGHSVAPWEGYIDEVRISHTARYTSNFTPSTTAFTSDADTKLLLHGEAGTGTGKQTRVHATSLAWA